MLTLQDRLHIAEEITSNLKRKLNVRGSANHFINIAGPILDSQSSQENEPDNLNPLKAQLDALRDEVSLGVQQFWRYRNNVNTLGMLQSVALAHDVYRPQRIKSVQWALLNVVISHQNMIYNSSRFIKIGLAEMVGLVLYELLANVYDDSCTLMSFSTPQASHKYFLVVLGIQQAEMNVFAYPMGSDEWSELIKNNPNAVVIDLNHAQGFYALSEIKSQLAQTSLMAWDTREERPLSIDTTQTHIDLHIQHLHLLKEECINEHPEIIELINNIDTLLLSRNPWTYRHTKQGRFFKEGDNHQGCEPPPGSFISSIDDKTIVHKDAIGIGFSSKNS